MRRAGTRAVERCQSVAKHHNQTTCRCATRRARLSVASCGPHARPRRRSASARRCGHDPVACGLLPNLLSGVWRRADSVRAIFYEEEEGAGPEGAHGSPSVAHELGGGKGAIAPCGDPRSGQAVRNRPASCRDPQSHETAEKVGWHGKRRIDAALQVLRTWGPGLWAAIGLLSYRRRSAAVKPPIPLRAGSKRRRDSERTWEGQCAAVPHPRGPPVSSSRSALRGRSLEPGERPKESLQTDCPPTPREGSSTLDHGFGTGLGYLLRNRPEPTSLSLGFPQGPGAKR